MDPVKLAALADIIAAPARIEDADGVLVREWEEQWVYRLPASLAHALAGLPIAEIPRVAQAWAAIEEWRLDGVDPGDDVAVAGLVALVGGLRQLAWQARHAGKGLYLWISL